MAYIKVCCFALQVCSNGFPHRNFNRTANFQSGFGFWISIRFSALKLNFD